MKDFSTFTTEYREQMLKNATMTNKDEAKFNNENAQQIHGYYEEVTAAGKPSYLKAEKKFIKMPQDLHRAIMEGKIEKAWKTFAMNPILNLEERYVEEQTMEIDKQGTMLSNATSASANKKANAALAVAVQEEQLKELTQGQINELNSKLQEMKKCSRWLPDSAQFTFFGKPPFHAYGNGNTDPTVGGGVYGQYMKTHNINPHAGGNRPKYC